MTTMIALIGEQTLANYLPIQHYKPSHVVLVYTSTTQTSYERLKVVLEKDVIVYGLKTDPYDITAIANSLNAELTKLAPLVSHSLLFNLTGGTKTMALAAYQVAERNNAPIIYLQSERGQNTIDYYSWKDKQLHRQTGEPLPSYLTLRDVLDLQLGREKDAEGKDIWQVKGPTVQDNNGHLLEIAIAKALQDDGYETMSGVKDSNSQVDVDVMMRNQNQVGIIEAKSGMRKELKGVRQLSTAMRYLSGTYTKQFLVIVGEASEDQTAICKPLRITIVSLLNYPTPVDTLTPEDTNILLTAVNKVMKA